MNFLIKLTLFIWLMFCALAAWIGCAVVGFMFAFSQYPFMYHITPLFGLTIAVCMFKCAMYVTRSNPVVYFEAKYDRLFKRI